MAKKRGHDNRSWAERLRARNLRMTCCRRGLLEVLDEADVPLTVEALAAAVNGLHEDHGHDLSTLYRNVETLQTAGIVRRIELGDGSARYELDEGHNHYVRCVKCGRMDAVGQCDLTKLVRQVERRLGYAVTGHHLHLTGLCRRCRR